MKRRDFLSAMAVGAMGGLIPAPARAQASRRLVVFFLRGGLDGLSALVPLEERWYWQARPSIAIPPPGEPGGALPLAKGFGLHPALEPLRRLWDEKLLAVIPACGLPSPVRTHPEAQRDMESGLPGDRHAAEGWMSRLLPLLEKNAKGLTLAVRPPLIGQGKPGLRNVQPTGYPPSIWRLERPAAFAAFDAAYKGMDALGRMYRQSQITLRNKLVELDREISVSAGGAPSVHALPQLAGQVADYLSKAPDARLVFAALGGFDAHFQQGAGSGRLAEAFLSLGKGMEAMAKALGPDLERTAVLFLSEFGRSLRENEFSGTDNGYATLCMVLGGGVAGGALHGPWPGLAPDKLADGLDLAVTVDFREPLAEIAQRHLGLDRAALAQILPGYMPTGAIRSLFNAPPS
ncbi:hypothetical protein NNJEOMEG_00197 [Fundidesulfovibrio magnetotacticus]|uniref:DUF1501 domain-containing protein n=1 Tax=Fundidesulfovibrio magnetotacticus TaxID=2730080 RepID=A0A6V8LI11_9BACT|nr:DUF1501 domain-containing protein [Fundidesulfovibrio magnetotacticus]GFK92372.1 hypothetical protein NNJEOMEG_00197 [Fundidesulfovibrio magnetotacticus]